MYTCPNGQICQTTATGSSVVYYENAHWAKDMVDYGETAIMLAIAVCLLTAARIAWVKRDCFLTKPAKR
jgi:hypothetical protein